MISNLPIRKISLRAVDMSSGLITWLGALAFKNVLASSRAREQFSRWTGIPNTLLSVGRLGFNGTIVNEVFFSAARACNTSEGLSSCGADNAGAPGLNIPDLCHAMDSTVGPSWSRWSSPREVIPVTTGFWMTFVASNSPPWWTSIIAASTFSRMKVWKASRAKSCR